MAPDENFESISYNPFKVNDSFINSENDPAINFYSDILLLDNQIKSNQIKQIYFRNHNIQ